MDAESIYASALGTLFTLILGWQLAAETWAWRHRASARFRKWVTNNPVGARQNGSSGISVGTVLGVLIVVSVNIFVSCFRVGTVAKVGRRLGIVAVANLTPLFLGGRSSLWANVLGGIPLPLYHTCHRWLGRICLVQGLVHGLIQLYLSAWKFTISDIVNISLLASIGLGSILHFRRRFYEVFLKLHLSLVLGLNVTLWFHINRGRNLQTICLALASFLWISNTAFWLTRIFFRNWSGPSLKIEHSVQLLSDNSSGPDGVLLKVRLRRPWKVQHGQYVYATIPSVPHVLFARIQSHPYLVAWSDGGSYQLSKEVYLLIEGRRGFSRALRQFKDVSSVILDGPYGKSPRFDRFDKVLLIAYGVGIAAHLLTIRHLLRAHEEQTARVRRISLTWVLENKAQEAWAMSFLETLYDSDIRRIFTILIYEPSSTSTTTPRGPTMDPKRSRLYRVSQAVDVEWLISNEWSAEAGNMVVSLCGAPAFEKRVRTALRSSPHDIRLWTSPFEMDETAYSREIHHKQIKRENLKIV